VALSDCIQAKRLEHDIPSYVSDEVDNRLNLISADAVGAKWCSGSRNDGRVRYSGTPLRPPEPHPLTPDKAFIGLRFKVRDQEINGPNSLAPNTISPLDSIG
jgi:hypothetical protein